MHIHKCRHIYISYVVYIADIAEVQKAHWSVDIKIVLERVMESPGLWARSNNSGSEFLLPSQLLAKQGKLPHHSCYCCCFLL